MQPERPTLRLNLAEADSGFYTLGDFSDKDRVCLSFDWAFTAPGGTSIDIELAQKSNYIDEHWAKVPDMKFTIRSTSGHGELVNEDFMSAIVGVEINVNSYGITEGYLNIYIISK